MITLNEEKQTITMSGIHTITVFGLHAICLDLINCSERNPPPADLIASSIAFDLAATEFMTAADALDREFTTQDVRYVAFLLQRKKELVEVYKVHRLSDTLEKEEE